MTKKITIVTSEAFPYGMAGTNRIISMAKGFIANGVQADVVSFYKYAKPGINILNPTTGVFEGIKFKNVFRSQTKSSCLLMRIIHEYSKPVLVFLHGMNYVGKKSVVLYYADKTWPAIALKIVALAKRIVLLREETEHPTIRMENKTKLGKLIYLNYHYKVFDGLLVITQNLYDYFVRELNYGKPILLVPMIVDIDRFNQTKHQESQSIVFSGELDDRKEGVTTLIKAFSLISKKYPGLMLELFGSTPDKFQESLFYQLVKDLDLEQRVIFHGYKNRVELTDALCKARLFVFSRPPSLQAQFGFSTKLGEYLATGKPVIVSPTGEIGKYLTDGINAFICKSDPNLIAARIEEIQQNYQRALKIGNEGRNTALLHFNNKIESEKIIEFLRTFFNRNLPGLS